MKRVWDILKEGRTRISRADSIAIRYVKEINRQIPEHTCQRKDPHSDLCTDTHTVSLT